MVKRLSGRGRPPATLRGSKSAGCSDEGINQPVMVGVANSSKWGIHKWKHYEGEENLHRLLQSIRPAHTFPKVSEAPTLETYHRSFLQINKKHTQKFSEHTSYEGRDILETADHQELEACSSCSTVAAIKGNGLLSKSLNSLIEQSDNSPPTFSIGRDAKQSQCDDPKEIDDKSSEAQRMICKSTRRNIECLLLLNLQIPCG
ncbi:hypothetical protein EJB05_38783, partial [Eragrostis curvula]